MRYKPVPEPRSIADLIAIQEAVPLVPGEVEDCCSRIVTRTGVAGRDSARTWLTFLTALDLTRETDRGFYRTREDPDRDELATRFRDGVFGVREICTIILENDAPVGASLLFDSFREYVPEWERHRRTDWESAWRDRMSRLLEWGVTFGLLVRVDGGAFDIRTPG